VRAVTGLLIVIATSALACAPMTPIEVEPTPNGKPALAELWVEPPADRDLFYGVGGKRLAPDPSLEFNVIEIKRGGFSQGLTVEESSESARTWSAKFPPEAHSEVTSSRILWGIGYHQPPVYFVSRWNAKGADTPNPQLPSRFREKKPDLHGLDDTGPWSYYRNPFVGTTQLKGLLVLQALLGNDDLKDDNNALYTLTTPLNGAARWYVARDVGHTLGRPALSGTREGDVKAFEQQPFIEGVANGRVQLAGGGGRHKALYQDITPADVRWVCTRLSRLSDSQWEDAFRAGGYSREDALRFIRRLKAHIAAGLALKG
jgi:hypothetical protein